MADIRLYMNKVTRWEHLDTAVTTNQVPNQEGNLPKLRDKSKRMREMYAQHSALAAARQAITQEMQQLIEEGDQVVRVVREAVKEPLRQAQREAGRVRDPAAAGGRREAAPQPQEEVGRAPRRARRLRCLGS